ncbi:hypothetical protein M569_10219, partial [Genlisea aurea]
FFSGVFIDCGADSGITLNGIQWIPDAGYVSAGTPRAISVPVLAPILAKLRSFPLRNNVFKKFCYEIPVDRARKYLVRTSYYYGGVNGNANPPVFDQIVDGTFWSVVNTTVDYANGSASYYEGIFMPKGKNLSVCVAANTYTDSDPFISALEVVLLFDQLYNSTDFTSNALALIARHSFGDDGRIVEFPDDRFNRYWQPFGAYSFMQTSSRDLSVSGIWNLPPSKVFETRLASGLTETLTLSWPPGILPDVENNYYIALYFADLQTSSGSSRMMDIAINGIAYYRNLTVSPEGLVVFANQWRLNGSTTLSLTSSPGSSGGPLINAGEVFQVIPSVGRTLSRDVIALLDLRNSFLNPPVDWNGEPCLPSQFAWTGITCSGGIRNRVVSLNLTGMGLSGIISPTIAQLTALKNIFLGNNSLYGVIP